MKKLILCLLVSASCVQAGTLSCGTYQYKGYMNLDNYGAKPSNLPPITMGNGVTNTYTLATASLTGKNSTYQPDVNWSITNDSPANVIVKNVHIMACYNSVSASSAGCFTSTNGNYERNQVSTCSTNLLIPPKTKISGTCKLPSNDQKMQLALVATGPYIADTVTVANTTSSLIGDVDWADTSLSAIHQTGYVGYSPTEIATTWFNMPDQVYTDALKEGDNGGFSIANNMWGNTTPKVPTITYTVKDASEGVKVNLAGYLKASGETQEVDGSHTVGLYINEGATPGPKTATIEARWTCS